MSIAWSGWSYAGGNGMRVGIDYTVAPVSNSSSSYSITFQIYTENEYSYSDSGETLTYSGNLSGTTSFNNTSGGGTVVHRDTQTYSNTYPGGSYGSSPGNVTCSVRVGGTYNGSAPFASVTVPVPVRPYAPPAAPTSVSATRTDDSHVAVAWSNNATAGAPYNTLSVEWSVDDGPWQSRTTLSGTATGYTETGITPNHTFAFRLRANNAAGSSGWTGSSNRVATTPGAPSGVSCGFNPDGTVEVTWTSTVNYSQYTSTVERSDGGGAYAVVASGIRSASQSKAWQDSSPGAVSVRYRVKAVADYGSLPSAYGFSPTLSTVPGTPTSVQAALQADGTITVTWANNMQYTAYTVDVDRQNGTGAWATVASSLASGTATWTDQTPPGGVNGYRVYVYGNIVGKSGYGLSNTVSTMVPPLAPTVLSPDGGTVDFTVAQVFTWQHNPGTDGADVSQVELQVSSDGGTTWTAYDSGMVASTVSQWTFPAGTLANGAAYLWRVREEDVPGAGWGPYSATAAVTGSTTPTVAVTSPGASVTFSPLGVAWSFSQAEASPQAAWQVQLYTGSTVVASALMEDSGQQSGTDSTYTTQSPVLDGSIYTVQVRGKSGAGLWSAWTPVTFTVSLLPPANVATMLTYDPGTGTTQVTLTPDAAIAPGTVVATNLCPNPHTAVVTSTGATATYSYSPAPATPGTTYTAAADLSGAAVPCGVYLIFVAGDGTQAGAVAGSTAVLTAPQRRSVSAVAPAGTVTVLLRVYVLAAGTVTADNPSVQEGTAVEFFDGDTGMSQDLVIPDGPGGVHVERESADLLYVGVNLSGDKWWRQGFRTIGGLPMLCDAEIAHSVEVTAPSITWQDQEVTTRAGDAAYTWTGAGSQPNAAAYGGDYRYSAVAGATATWTTPSDSTSVGIRYITAPNGGYGTVSIDGDLTAATGLPTAQAEVDAGRLPSAALTANGGTLDPATRVFDCYAAQTVWDVPVTVADSLTVGAHQIVITATGYQETAATAARMYLSGIGSTGPVTTTSQWVTDKTLLTGAYSAYEYAINCNVPGGIPTYIGSVHGNETLVSLTVQVDGAQVTVADGQRIDGTQSVVVTRLSTLTSPDGSGTPVADVTTTYTATASGLDVSYSISWSAALEIVQEYAAMYPFDEGLTRGVVTGIPGVMDLTLGTGGASGGKRTQSLTAWAYDGAGSAAVHVTLPDVSSVNGWANSAPTDGGTWIEDRAGNAINKAYFSRVSTNGGPVTVASGDVWTSEALYRAAWLTAPPWLSSHFVGGSVYSWTGTAGASTSEQVYVGTATVDHADLQRQIDGGAWVTILSGITFDGQTPITVLDTTPTVNGTNSYRVVATSISPSQATFAAVDVTTTAQGAWIFLSYGDGFATILRMRDNPSTSETAGRNRASTPLLGNNDPVLLVGQNRSRAVTAQASLAFDPAMADPSSSDADFRDAAQNADMVLYRDYLGRRVFGELSNIQITDSKLRWRSQVAFTVTETRFAEGYLYGS